MGRMIRGVRPFRDSCVLLLAVFRSWPTDPTKYYQPLL